MIESIRSLEAMIEIKLINNLMLESSNDPND